MMKGISNLSPVGGGQALIMAKFLGMVGIIGTVLLSLVPYCSGFVSRQFQDTDKVMTTRCHQLHNFT